MVIGQKRILKQHHTSSYLILKILAKSSVECTFINLILLHDISKTTPIIHERTDLHLELSLPSPKLPPFIIPPTCPQK
jgi:hypothetical protein